MQDFDFAVIGAGIAGVSAAYHLAPRAKVIMLEREHVAAYRVNMAAAEGRSSMQIRRRSLRRAAS